MIRNCVNALRLLEQTGSSSGHDSPGEGYHPRERLPGKSVRFGALRQGANTRVRYGAHRAEDGQEAKPLRVVVGTVSHFCMNEIDKVKTNYWQ